MPNRLSNEASPYLKQHAMNPVDWYPWGDEALNKARSENKPILLSIGYSACHWCHVMEHESFENAEIARLMNENFVNIKVDREERPDLDQIYQNVAQLMTRGGGWPLTVFLTPDLKPFFGGTYFPPEDRYGRPGFPRVLVALSDAYKNDAASVAENAKKISEAIAHLESAKAEQNERPSQAALRKICDQLVGAVDWRHGGFGGAPKFPNTMSLSYLWRFATATGFGMAQEAVTVSLTQMAQGGIYDQLGGGFHRYSVDERWAVPHFEKMLYDNALLLKLYSEVCLANTAQPGLLSADDVALYLRVIVETAQYVLREMKSPDTMFYSTQDADSEGVEGKFFVWNPENLQAELSPDEARIFVNRFGVTEHGNFEHSKDTVLAVTRPLEQTAKECELPLEATIRLLDSAKSKLFKAREKRVKPGLDDKCLVSWNGLMISGLAWASQVLATSGQAELGAQAMRAAEEAFSFIEKKMSRDQNRLWSVHHRGEKPRFNAYLDDYAFAALGALDLARFSSNASSGAGYIRQASRWIDVALEHFKDRENGGYFFTSDDHEKLIQRPKSYFDQAIPSGNAVIIECLVVLAALTENPKYETAMDENLYTLFPLVTQSPQGMGELACAALLSVAGPVTVTGPGAHLACTHPHIWQKPETGQPLKEQLVVCHRKTCDRPQPDAKAARELALSKISLS